MPRSRLTDWPPDWPLKTPPCWDSLIVSGCWRSSHLLACRWLSLSRNFTAPRRLDIEMSKTRSGTVQRIMTAFLLGLGLPAMAAAQQAGSSFELASIATPRTINPATNSNTPSTLAGQQQNPFLGSVPTGTLSATPVELSLQDAIERGVHFNLGVIEDQSSLRQAQAQRLRALSALLPT